VPFLVTLEDLDLLSYGFYLQPPLLLHPVKLLELYPLDLEPVQLLELSADLLLGHLLQSLLSLIFLGCGLRSLALRGVGLRKLPLGSVMSELGIIGVSEIHLLAVSQMLP
jgi:hypothetical protein